MPFWVSLFVSSIALVNVVDPEPQEVARRFRDSASKYRSKFANVKCDYELQFDNGNPQASHFFRAHVRGIRRDGERLVRRQLYETDRSAHYDNIDEIVECLRDDLGFVLHKRRSPPGYVITKFTDTPISKQRLELAIHRGLDAIIMAPVQAYDVDVASLFERYLEQIQVCKYQDEVDGAIAVQWRCDGIDELKNYASLRVILDPKYDDLITEYEIVFRSSPGLISTRSASVEYHSDRSLGVFVPKRVVMDEKNEDVGAGTSRSARSVGAVENLSFGAVTPSDLSLGQFGFPDPRESRGWPWYGSVALGAAVLLFLFVLIRRWWLRHR